MLENATVVIMAMSNSLTIMLETNEDGKYVERRRVNTFFPMLETALTDIVKGYTIDRILINDTKFGQRIYEMLKNKDFNCPIQIFD